MKEEEKEEEKAEEEKPVFVHFLQPHNCTLEATFAFTINKEDT